jgi:undecaprenyl-diphosphatase
VIGTLLRRIGGWVGRLFGQPEADERAPATQTVPANGVPDDTTDEPIGASTRRSLVPRWLAALRTQTFTGLAALGLIVFGGLTMLVTGGLTAQADLAATQAVQGIAAPWFGSLMLAVSLFGFPPQAFWLVIVASALLWRAGLHTESRFALLASGSVLLTEAIKQVVGRPRPDAGLVTVVESIGGHSFPSGHTLFYVTFFGFLAYLAYAQLKPGRLRTVVLWVTGLLVLLVGPSRIWMGQHWASDVLASYALGLTYLILLVQLYARRRLAREMSTTRRVPALTPG